MVKTILKTHFIKIAFASLCLQLACLPQQALSFNGNGFTAEYYQPTKGNVLRLLDEMDVEFELDKDGDVYYLMNDKGWRAYIIFHTLGQGSKLWALQLRTQFSSKAEHYNALVKYANQWNANNVMPKVSMKNKTKLILSFTYPVQYGLNADEFKVNVFSLFQREAEKIAKQTKKMR